MQNYWSKNYFVKGTKVLRVGKELLSKEILKGDALKMSTMLKENCFKNATEVLLTVMITATNRKKPFSF